MDEGAMVIPGFKAYDVKCLSCNWKKMIPVRTVGDPFGLLDKIRLPSKSPECGGKVSKKENKNVCF